MEVTITRHIGVNAWDAIIPWTAVTIVSLALAVDHFGEGRQGLGWFMVFATLANANGVRRAWKGRAGTTSTETWIKSLPDVK